MREACRRTELSCPSGGSVHQRFTLLVIAIIAILAALLLPALRSARETAKKAGCINNQKNINMYIHQYADQNRQTLYLLGSWQDWYIKMALMAGRQYKKALTTGDSQQYDTVNSYISVRTAGRRLRQLCLPPILYLDGHVDASSLLNTIQGKNWNNMKNWTETANGRWSDDPELK